MSIKSIVSILLLGGALMFLGIRPSDMLDQGSNFWSKFSGDFLAIFNGAEPGKVAKATQVAAGDDERLNCVAEAGSTDDESTLIAREVVHDRCEQAKREKELILNPEALRNHLENQNRQSE